MCRILKKLLVKSVTNVFLQNCPVDAIIVKQTSGSINGPQLVMKLKGGEVYNKPERLFFVKTVAKYLMSGCEV